MVDTGRLGTKIYETAPLLNCLMRIPLVKLNGGDQVLSKLKKKIFKNRFMTDVHIS